MYTRHTHLHYWPSISWCKCKLEQFSLKYPNTKTKQFTYIKTFSQSPSKVKTKLTVIAWLLSTLSWKLLYVTNSKSQKNKITDEQTTLHVYQIFLIKRRVSKVDS